MARSIDRIPRDAFVTEYWDPEPGEHVSLMGKTGTGKTTLGMALMREALDLNPHTRGLVLAMKPDKGPEYKGRQATGDETVAKLARRYGGRITRTYPPPPRLWDLMTNSKGDRRLDVYWPRHTMDPRQDVVNHHYAFQNALIDCYKKGGRWIFADEAYSLCEELDLDPELITLWTKGRSMETSVIAATQKPTHVPRWMYSQATHLFLWKDNDVAARKRYAEISGADPREIADVLSRLAQYECLYLNVREDTMAILV